MPFHPENHESIALNRKRNKRNVEGTEAFKRVQKEVHTSNTGCIEEEEEKT